MSHCLCAFRSTGRSRVFVDVISSLRHCHDIISFMNTRSFNLAATSRKRRRAAQTSHHDRAPIEEDFGPVRWREETVSSRKHVLTTSGREYLRNDNSWSVGESWLPEDNAAFGLEEESVWFDDDEEGVCIDLQPPLPAPSGKKKRSIVSVSYLFHHFSKQVSCSGRVDPTLFGSRSTGTPTWMN